MKLTEFFNSPSLQRLAFVIRVGYRSQYWQKRRPRLPFKLLTNNFDRVTKSDNNWNHDEVVAAFSQLYSRVVESDSRLYYKTEDVIWFIKQLDNENYLAIHFMKVLWTTPHEYLTLEEVTEITTMSARTWREKAAKGRVPGATKKGKTWLIPKSYITLIHNSKEEK